MPGNEYYLSAKRSGKDTVFSDLFHIPRYAAQLVNDLHKDLNITESEIRSVTLHPILLNKPYNDLGVLVRDKLLIFVEAQSTWSINVLIRLLIYLALSYGEYIKIHELNIYGTKPLTLPKPEFYVIYTGDRKDCPRRLSLAKEFFAGNCAVDLTAHIVTDADDNGIAGQYVRFCKIFNRQVKLHGYTEKAITETLRICRDEKILTEYLKEREKEVITVMTMLFDQEYAVNAYAKEYAKERELKTAIEFCQEFGQTFAATVKKVAEKFNLPLDVAEKNVQTYWVCE